MAGKRTRVAGWFSRFIAFFSTFSACRTFGKHSECFIDRFFLASWRSLSLFSQFMLLLVVWFFISFFPRDLTNLMYFILPSYDHWYQTSVGIARCWDSSDKRYQGPFNLKGLMINYTFLYKLDKMRFYDIFLLGIAKRYFFGRKHGVNSFRLIWINSRSNL